jgi:hypothetical protein
MKISILCQTARANYCIPNRPDYHLFELLLDSVEKQDFVYLSEVEVIFIDARYASRRELFGSDGHTFKDKKYTCTIKHVDQTADNPYFKKGRWVESLALNKGIIAADGELLMTTVDRSWLLSTNLLTKAWDYYKNENKFLLLGWIPAGEFANGPEHQDHRYQVLRKEGLVTKKVSGSWFYGYSFYSLEAALRVNGYDVGLDCLKCMTDCDFGLRLEAVGYNFIMDTSVVMGRYVLNNGLDIKDVCEVPKIEGQGCFKPSVGIMHLNQQDKQYIANIRQMTPELIDRAWVYFRILEPNNDTEYAPKPGTPEYDLLQWWYDNQVFLNLVAERKIKRGLV